MPIGVTAVASLIFIRNATQDDMVFAQVFTALIEFFVPGFNHVACIQNMGILRLV